MIVLVSNIPLLFLLAAQSTQVTPAVHEDLGGAAHFGSSLARVDDLDGDGLAELAVGEAAVSLDEDRVVWVIAGSLDRVVHKLVAPDRDWFFGFQLCDVGDVDGDGLSDVAVAACPVPWDVACVLVYSGSTGEILYELRGEAPFDGFGARILSAGDQDRDGVPDIVVSAHSAGPERRGRVYLFSGATGVELASWAGTRDREEFGSGIATVQGQHANEPPAIAVLAAGGFTWPEGRFNAGPPHIRLLSGSTGEVLRTIEVAGTPEDPTRMVEGRTLKAAPDLDGDGRLEFLVQFWQECEPFKHGIFAISGADGEVLRIIEGEARSNLGCALDLLGDINGDRVPELVVGADGGWGGAVHICSLRDERSIRPLYDRKGASGPVSRHLGFNVVTLGDLNGDGVPDYAAALVAYGAPGRLPGEVWVLSGKDNKRLATLTKEVVASWPVGMGDRDD